MEWFISNMLKYVTETTGIYVEVGANDGVTQSYTYELEKLGWHGILIEPSKVAFDMCAKDRPNNKLFNCALVASEDMKEIYGDFYGSFLASIGSEWYPKHRAKPARPRGRPHAQTLASGARRYG